ncbi:unnamed protein product [Calypogeia fissa]
MASPSFSIGMSAVASIFDPTTTEVQSDPTVSTDLVIEVGNLTLDDETRAELDKLNAALDVDENASVRPSQPVVVNVQGRPSFEFLVEDEHFQKTLAKGGINPSASVDRWAVNRITRFRQFKEWKTSILFEDLSGPQCVHLLTKVL